VLAPVAKPLAVDARPKAVLSLHRGLGAERSGKTSDH
jgi:hypothetical protein